MQGDGIVLFRVIHGRIDSSVAWNTGMQVTETTGTPNAIWTWMCDDCTVEGNEAYLTDSPGVDGGAYDIDYGNTKNSVIDNYGHDTQGYCVAVFGAGFVTKESTVRGNLCVNNGRSPRMAKYQGAIFLLSWNDGSIDGLTVENNTVYWSPFENSPALVNQATIKAGTAAFRNNTIYSTSPWIVDSNTSLVTGTKSLQLLRWRKRKVALRNKGVRQPAGITGRPEAGDGQPLRARAPAGVARSMRITGGGHTAAQHNGIT